MTISSANNNETPSTAPLPQATCSAAALRAHLDDMLDTAQWGIANEKLGGNVVKAEFWVGQQSAVWQVLKWLDAEMPNPQAQRPDSLTTHAVRDH